MAENRLKARLIHVLERGKGGPVILLGSFSGRDEAQRIFEETEKLTDKPFVLVVFETENWNLELSPWPAEGMDKDRPFPGGGPGTLDWLRSAAIPFVRENFGDVPVFTAGYSLAGLFALWALYEAGEPSGPEADKSSDSKACAEEDKKAKGVFSGAICCSGSLWFPGWMEKARRLKAPENSRIYLSLGGKEERTEHPVVKRIGDDTREMDAILDRDSGVAAHKLEWNKGGHFADSAKRQAKGIAWILE